jgi:hypothetical protein
MIYDFAREKPQQRDEYFPLVAIRQIQPSDCDRSWKKRARGGYALTQVCQQLRYEFQKTWLQDWRIVVSLPCLDEFIKTFFPNPEEYRPASISILWQKQDERWDLTNLLRLKASHPTMNIEILPWNAFRMLAHSKAMFCMSRLNNTGLDPHNVCVHTNCRGFLETKERYYRLKNFAVHKQIWLEQSRSSHIKAVTQIVNNKSDNLLVALRSMNIEVRAELSRYHDRICLEIDCNSDFWDQLHMEGGLEVLKNWGLPVARVSVRFVYNQKTSKNINGYQVTSTKKREFLVQKS